MNKKIILSIASILGVLIIAPSVFAATSNLTVSPTTGDQAIGTNFDISVQIATNGNKVCVAKGTLNFDNLSCQKITVESGLIAQVSPTCESPSFSIGIPKCTTVDKNIMTVSVNSDKTGPAGLGITGSRVIGVGRIVASTFQNGTYNITEQTAQNNNEAAGLQAAGIFSSGSGVWWLIILVIIAGLVYLYFSSKKKKE